MNRDKLTTRIATESRHISRQICANHCAVNRKSERYDTEL